MLSRPSDMPSDMSTARFGTILHNQNQSIFCLEEANAPTTDFENCEVSSLSSLVMSSLTPVNGQAISWGEILDLSV